VTIPRFWRRRRRDQDPVTELEAYLAHEIDNQVAAGRTVEDARSAAHRKLGNVTRVREEIYEMNSMRWLEWLWQDVRYAVRLVRRSPAFAMSAIVSLALAIGANTLVFSVLNGIVLRRLPVPSPDQVVFVQSSVAGAGAHSFPNYRDLRDRNTAFSGLVGYRISPMSVETGDGAARVWGYLATGNYFQVLGVTPEAGRLFVPEDDRQPGAAPYAVVSYESWQRRFLGDPSIVGRTIRINRLPYTVIGVAPRAFYGTEIFYRPEIWVPMMMQAQIEVGNPWLERRETQNTWVAGRLRPEVSTAQAETNLNAIAADLRRDYPGQNRNLRITLTQPGLAGDALRQPMRAFTLGVFILSALVLVVGCANLASILLAHGADRQREMALRTSIGAGRGRLLQQMLTESLLLSLAGGLAGTALAFAVSAGLSKWSIPLDLPVQLDVRADSRVLFFGIVASILAGVLFGLAPARQASRTDPNSTLKGVPDAPAVGRPWPMREWLVGVQVALCVVLLSACLLSVVGLRGALSVPTGFQLDGVAVAGFELGLAGYTEEKGREFQAQVVEALSRLPGIDSAAWSNSLPLSIDQSSTTVSAQWEPKKPSSGVGGVTFYQVSPGFFRTLGTRLLAGRDFNGGDRSGSLPVAIVNETFARRVLRGPDAVGKRFRYGWSGEGLVEVIGVVEDGKYTTLTEDPRPALFQPILQRYNSTTTVAVRSRLPEERVAGEIRRAIASLDSTLPIYGAGSLRQYVQLAWFPSRVAAVALTAFGVLALVLAGTGIHGLVAYSVARRRKEIGIRIAVGAGRADVLKLVLSRVIKALGAGAILGFGLAFAVGPMLGNVVYLASPRDPTVIAGVAVLLMAIGVASCWSPLRRSLRIDPLQAVRSE
jgi:predicted permease